MQVTESWSVPRLHTFATIWALFQYDGFYYGVKLGQLGTNIIYVQQFVKKASFGRSDFYLFKNTTNLQKSLGPRVAVVTRSRTTAVTPTRSCEFPDNSGTAKLFKVRYLRKNLGITATSHNNGLFVIIIYSARKRSKPAETLHSVLEFPTTSNFKNTLR